MPNKPVRQNAKYREAQLRKRGSAQGRGAGALDTAEREEMPTDTVRLDGAPAPEAPVMRFAPSGGAATAAATRAAAPARRPATAAAAGAATSAARSARGRIAAQMHEMNLADEMQFIRDDIRRLLLLAVVSFAVLIVLAFVIH
jgi:hypothetical protein